jgi:hypothetical protein
MDVLDQITANAATEYRATAIAVANDEFVTPEKLSGVLQLSGRTIGQLKADVATNKVRKSAIAILADENSDSQNRRAARRALKLTGHPVDQRKLDELEQRKSLLTGQCEKLNAFLDGRSVDDYTKRPIAVDTPQSMREKISAIEVQIHDWTERSRAAGVHSNQAERLQADLAGLNERLVDVDAEHAEARIKRDKMLAQIEGLDREISEVPRPEHSTDFADHPFDGVSHHSKVSADNQARELSELRSTSMGNRGY